MTAFHKFPLRLVWENADSSNEQAVNYSSLVLQEDRERFLKEVSPESIIHNTANRMVYSVPFRRVFEDGIRHYLLEFIKLNADDGAASIIAGFKDVEAEVH